MMRDFQKQGFLSDKKRIGIKYSNMQLTKAKEKHSSEINCHCAKEGDLV